MMRRLPLCLGVTVVLVLIAFPIWFAVRQQASRRHFRVVRPGVLYRSGQMTSEGLRRVVHDYGIRTVVNLRDGSTRSDQIEERWCTRAGVRFLRIPPSVWTGSGEGVPAEEGLRKFLAVMKNPRNHPVLVHCFAGIHRTGAYCAIYRMELDGWDNERALAEMRACGYTNLDDEWDILGYLERYRPAGPSQPTAAPAASH